MRPRRIARGSSVERLVARVDAQRPGAPLDDTVPTGFPSIDRLLGGGVRRTDLIVLGGDVGSGKSALALGMALRSAQSGADVVFFSGEMTEERLMERALAIEGRVSVDELRVAKVNDQGRAGIGAAAVRLRGLSLTILPLAVGDFESLAAQLEPPREADLIIIDYLQLVPSPSTAGRHTQDEELALTLRRLKQVAVDRQTAVIVVGQLPAFTASRPNPRPTIEDFGTLGAVKQHADLVLTIFREEMYAPSRGVEGTTELAVVKNRNGPKGFVDLYFYRRWMRFEDMLDPDR